MPATIDEYIHSCPEPSQAHLKTIRSEVHALAPHAEETISYGIACFRQHGTYLLYFAGYKKHVAIYPVPGDDPALNKAMAAYKTSGKGTLQFPLEKPLPLPLVRKVIRAMLKRNTANAKPGKKS